MCTLQVPKLRCESKEARRVYIPQVPKLRCAFTSDFISLLSTPPLPQSTGRPGTRHRASGLHFSLGLNRILPFGEVRQTILCACFFSRQMGVRTPRPPHRQLPRSACMPACLKNTTCSVTLSRCCEEFVKRRGGDHSVG